MISAPAPKDGRETVAREASGSMKRSVRILLFAVSSVYPPARKWEP